VASIIERINFDGLFNLMLAIISLTAPVSATLLSRSIFEGGFCLFLAINRELSGKYHGRLQMNSAYCAIQSIGIKLANSFLLLLGPAGCLHPQLENINSTVT
jgi:hypothetical protein